MKEKFVIIVAIFMALLTLGCSEKNSIRLQGEYALSNGDTVTVQLGKPQKLSNTNDRNISSMVGESNGAFYPLSVEWSCTNMDIDKTYMVEHTTDQFIDLYELDYDGNGSICGVEAPIHKDYIGDTHFFRLLEMSTKPIELYSFDFVLKEKRDE